MRPGGQPQPRRSPLRRRRLAAGLVLLAVLCSSPAARARGNDCAFQSTGQLRLAFGDLTPGQAGRIQQKATANRREDLSVGDCAPGMQMRIRVEGGTHDAGHRLRMKHATRNAYLPYAVQASPAATSGPGNGRYITIDLIGTIQAADLADAYAGAYHDLLYISVTP